MFSSLHNPHLAGSNLTDGNQRSCFAKDATDGHQSRLLGKRSNLAPNQKSRWSRKASPKIATYRDLFISRKRRHQACLHHASPACEEACQQKAIVAWIFPSRKMSSLQSKSCIKLQKLFSRRRRLLLHRPRQDKIVRTPKQRTTSRQPALGVPRTQGCGCRTERRKSQT